MSKPFKPAKYPQLILHITVQNAEDSIDFYTKGLGFTVFDLVKDETGAISHAELTFGEVMLMLAPEGAYGDTTHRSPNTLGVPASSTFYLYVEDIDATYERCLRHGVKTAIEPQDAFWGDRFCRIVDPQGYEWMLATMINPEAHGEFPSA